MGSIKSGAAAAAFAVLGVTMTTSSAAAADPWVTNGQAAALVVGQADLDSNGSGLSATKVDQPQGSALDLANGKLYVCDYANNRVLRFAYPVAGNLPSAEMVFGQSDFTSNDSNSGGLSASSMWNPWRAAVDSTGRLFVSDSGNNRVLVFNAAHTLAAPKPAADTVLGQDNFVSNAPDLDAFSMDRPVGVAVDDAGTLWVADNNNHRVLRFADSALLTNGAPADGVLGQSSFGASAAATAADGMSGPIGLAVSGTTLYVSETGNNRVLRFANAAARINGAPADGVLGQSDFTSMAAGATANRMSFPYGIAADWQGRLYVADFFNNRVLIFDNAAAKGLGASADNVLGQTEFTSTSMGFSASEMALPGDVAVHSVNNTLLVNNLQTHRVQIFQASANLPVALTSFSAE